MFEYSALKDKINEALNEGVIGEEKRIILEDLQWLVDSFILWNSNTITILLNVLFPMSNSESRGIEDARFVRFTDDDGSEKCLQLIPLLMVIVYFPNLFLQKTFIHLMPLYGVGSKNKNLALFPRKVNGKYAMLSRIDGVNNYLMYSDSVTQWDNPTPTGASLFMGIYSNWKLRISNLDCRRMVSNYTWCRSYETLLHRCVLFDLDDPSKEIGRLKEPLLSPREDEREGYVPNVVYSCDYFTTTA
jgi:predicted GH43/DUF377 family glycosyl hydrolase